jgi:hypothetical protein
MKLLLSILFALVTSSGINAAEPIVVDVFHGEIPAQGEVRVRYVVERDQVRVRITVDGYSPEGGEAFDFDKRVSVSGITLLKAEKLPRRIVFANDGNETVCAEEDGRWYEDKEFRNTGNCKFEDLYFARTKASRSGTYVVRELHLTLKAQ